VAPASLSLASPHMMGSAGMSGAPDRSALNPDGETRNVENLVVAGPAVPSRAALALLSVSGLDQPSGGALSGRGRGLRSGRGHVGPRPRRPRSIQPSSS
jgi:hypothetical protein